jgi:formiminotetrahydrofolate cyclodeaminase
MACDKAQTIDAFLSATAAKQPTPGGGSVAALAGALSAAIGEMVVNYSIGKKDLAQHQDELRRALTELTRARQILLELMIEDQAAYEALSTVRKLPESDAQRQARFDAALLACIRIPQAIGATSAAILQLCQNLVDRVNKYLLSDLAVCAELAMATVRCAAYNVRVNMGDVADAAERKRFESAAARHVADCGPVIRDVIARIWARQGYS